VEIVSLDSLLVYRYLDIGTAKPSSEIRKKVPHHMIDIVNPDEDFTAAHYAAGASSVIQDILQRGKIPLLVGGCGFYLKALEYGVDPSPAATAEVRKTLLEEEEKLGKTYLYEKLKAIDPQRASEIHPHDGYRIQRALEIFYMTGRRASEFRKVRVKGVKIHKIGVHFSREVLRERILRRTKEMWEQGLVEEVKGLFQRGYSERLSPLGSVGYAETISYLKGELSEEDCLSLIGLQTAQLAKRQMTWFRKLKEIDWVKPEKAIDALSQSIASFF